MQVEEYVNQQNNKIQQLEQENVLLKANIDRLEKQLASKEDIVVHNKILNTLETDMYPNEQTEIVIDVLKKSDAQFKIKQEGQTLLIAF